MVCILRELYGTGIEKLHIEHMEFITPSKKKVEISTIASNYHIEMNPSDVGIHDRVVIMELLKEVAQSHSIDTSHREFKVVVLTEVDRLTKDAQHALRRTMEKYTSSCRLILLCNSTSKVIPAIKSRCLGIRIAAPTIDEICGVLQFVCRKESLSLPAELAKRIAEKSERNLRKAILLCEACRVQQYPFSADQNIPDCEWELFLHETATMIIEEQTPRRLLDVRGRYYELLTHCIPPDVIFKHLLAELIINCDGSLKASVIQLAAQYQHQVQLGTKAIFHLEAFTAKFMRLYKQFLEEGLADMMF